MQRRASNGPVPFSALKLPAHSRQTPSVSERTSAVGSPMTGGRAPIDHGLSSLTPIRRLEQILQAEIEARKRLQQYAIALGHQTAALVEMHAVQQASQHVDDLMADYIRSESGAGGAASVVSSRPAATVSLPYAPTAADLEFARTSTSTPTRLLRTPITVTDSSSAMAPLTSSISLQAPAYVASQMSSSYAQASTSGAMASLAQEPVTASRPLAQSLSASSGTGLSGRNIYADELLYQQRQQQLGVQQQQRVQQQQQQLELLRQQRAQQEQEQQQLAEQQRLEHEQFQQQLEQDQIQQEAAEQSLQLSQQIQEAAASISNLGVAVGRLAASSPPHVQQRAARLVQAPRLLQPGSQQQQPLLSQRSELSQSSQYHQSSLQRSQLQQQFQPVQEQQQQQQQQQHQQQQRSDSVSSLTEDAARAAWREYHAAALLDTDGTDTELYAVAENNLPAVYGYLLSNPLNGMNDIMGFGGNLLHLAASHGSADVVALLVELGFDINAPDADGDTPLMLVVRAPKYFPNGVEHKEHKLRATKILMDAGADRLARNAQDHTALDLCEYNELHMLVMLGRE